MKEIFIKAIAKSVFWICLTIVILRYLDTCKSGNGAYDPVKTTIDQTAKSFNSFVNPPPTDPLAEQIKAIDRAFSSSFDAEKRKELVHQLIEKHNFANIAPMAEPYATNAVGASSTAGVTTNSTASTNRPAFWHP